MHFIYSVLVVLGYINCLPVSSQYIELKSPCPKTFEYETDYDSNVYGVIHLQPNGPISSIHIIANFTIATRLYSNYVGRIEPIDTSALQHQQFYKNSPIDYRVHFPVISPLPRLTALVVNNDLLCFGPGDVPMRNVYVTTVTLQHKLTLLGGHGSNNFNQFQPTRPKPAPVVNVIGITPNQDMYTLNVTKNSDGSWNAVPAFGDVPWQPTQPRPQTPPPPLVYPEDTFTTSKPVPPPPPAKPETIYPSLPSRLPSASASSNFECGVVSGGNEYVPLIYHGAEYTRGDWPWLVAIYKRKDGSLNFICSGTLVSNRHVVTAAHCMQQRSTLTSVKDIVVKVGVYNLEDWGDDVTVTRTLAFATIHESYNSSNYSNDLLVVTFERPVEFNTYIRPACLWSGNSDISRIVGASGVVAGWGASELGPGSKGEPRMVRIPVVSTATCRASNPDFHLLTSDNTLCAGDRKGAGPCLGDSGGGLYLLDGGRWRLRGVVSVSLRPKNGDTTCDLSQYIIFTDTAQYLRWIENVIKY